MACSMLVTDQREEISLPGGTIWKEIAGKLPTPLGLLDPINVVLVMPNGVPLSSP